MTKESLYSARAYKKALFFTLINLSIFLVFASQASGENDPSGHCRDSFEMYSMNLSKNSHIQAAELCVEYFEENFPSIEKNIDSRLSNVYESINGSSFYIYNKYKLECDFYENKKGINCDHFRKFFYEKTQQGDDFFYVELYHDRTIIESITKKNWSEVYYPLRNSLFSKEEFNLLKGELENCENYKDYLDFDYSRLNKRYKQAEFLYNLWLCLRRYDDENIFSINQSIIDFLDYPGMWISGYFEDALIANTSYFLTNYGPQSSYERLDSVLRKRFKLKNLQLEWIERWSNNIDSGIDLYYEDITNQQALLTYLNFADLYIQNSFIEPRQLKKNRNELLKFFQADLSPRDKILFYSSTGLVLLKLQRRMAEDSSCDLAEEYFILALNVLKGGEGVDDYTVSSLSENLVLLSNCFLQAKKYSVFELNDDWGAEISGEFFQKDLEKSLEYANLARDIQKERGLSENVIQKSFIDFLKLKFKFHSESKNSDYLLLINDIFIDLLENEKRIENIVWIESLKELINSYAFHKAKLDLTGEVLNDIVDPTSLYQLLERVRNIRAIKYSSAMNSDSGENIKQEFIENSEKIKIAESEIKRDFDEKLFKQLDELYSERQIILKKFYKKDDQINDFYNTNFDVLSDLKKNLKKNEAIINFQSSYSGMTIHVTTKDESKIFVNHLVNEYLVDTFSRQFRNSLKEGYENGTFRYDLAYLLYQLFFEEVDNYLGGDYTIYIYGNGLEQIPFNTLISKKEEESTQTEPNYKKLLSANWLIDRYNFLRIYPLRDNLSKEFNRKFLGVANSKFTKSGLSNLPNVIEEVKFLALASQSNENLLFDKDATKRNFKDLASQNFERIVIATHTVEPFWEGLTFESSIVFNDEKEDFMLTASEISMMNIETDMVVLSSCNTEQKDFNSIYKAFLVAGSNSVLYTHWELDTKSAPEITESFFKKLWFDPDVPKHESLRQTLLEMKSDFSDTKYAHPSFWGNFTLAYGTIN